jgi:transketolase
VCAPGEVRTALARGIVGRRELGRPGTPHPDRHTRNEYGMNTPAPETRAEEFREAVSLEEMSVEELSIQTIRTLAIDAIQQANSGHPGAPMALAPIAYVLSREMRYNPRNPTWFDRDRFVLSAGHASMLLYAMLYLSGYDLPLEEIREFRQWDSRTPGHPEHGLTAGVETTTGPLGQGIMTAVGMAMAEAHLGAVYNRPSHTVVDHFTYVVCSDGDLMEGASHEAASLAGHLGLGKLIALYDDNRITIDGSTDLTYSDDAAARFGAYGWHVQDLGDSANDVDAIRAALEAARGESDRPSLIIVRSHIGFGSPNKQDTSGVHGSPLGEAEVALTKQAYGWPEDSHFLVPDRALEHMREAVALGATAESEWRDRFDAYRSAHPELADQFENALEGRLPPNWSQDLPSFDEADGPMATRKASGLALNAIAARLPWLIGGSADLAPSNNTLIKGSGDFGRDDYGGRNIRWGIREHVMAAASTGMALHGGLRPYAATFFIFTDYARPAIRLAALMRQPVIYVMTHDSIGLGEDGPTHQPVEHLAALRAMPGLRVIRPADANETIQAWREAIVRRDGPTMLVLTRQGVPVLRVDGPGRAIGLSMGAYILEDADDADPDLILIASGSEVALALAARQALMDSGVSTRVVSMPSWEIFREQETAYQHEVLPPEITRRLAIEAGVSLGWSEWTGDAGDVIAIDSFGASAPADILFEQYGYSVENVVARARRLLEGE